MKSPRLLVSRTDGTRAEGHSAKSKCRSSGCSVRSTEAADGFRRACKAKYLLDRNVAFLSRSSGWSIRERRIIFLHRTGARSLPIPLRARRESEASEGNSGGFFEAFASSSCCNTSLSGFVSPGSEKGSLVIVVQPAALSAFHARS